MAGYVIADIEITDSALYEEYRKVSGATIAKYGGRYLAPGGSKFERLEGDWTPKRLVVVQFESAERAKEWWASEEYREAKQLRQRSAKTNLVVVEGA